MAKVLAISAQQLNDYLSGRRIPGNKMRERLSRAGFDDFWVMHGSKEQADAMHERNLETQARLRWPEEWRMIELLKRYGVNSVASLDGILKWWKGTVKMVEEAPRIKYKTGTKEGKR